MWERLRRRRVHLIAIFESHPALAAAMDGILSRGLLDLLDIGHSALIVARAGDAPLIVNNNVRAREGTFSGAVLGAALLGLGAVQGGILHLPRGGAIGGVLLALLVGCALGAGIGYGVAHTTRFGFPQPLLDEVAARLAGEQVALVLQVPSAQAAALEGALAGPGVQVERRALHDATPSGGAA